MPKKTTIYANKYAANHCRVFRIKLNLKLDADIIDKLTEQNSMQGYIKQLIREDIARTCPGSVPVSLNSAAMEILEEKAKETGRSVSELIALIVNEQLIRT